MNQEIRNIEQKIASEVSEEVSNSTPTELSDPQPDDQDDQNANDEFYERQEFVADPKQTLIRLDKFLMDRLSNRSRNKVQNAIRAGSVKVNDLDVKPNYKVKP
ncbi:MAG TPA: S4 domain-containing protein, partial [Saprospiraceae bacterium]|nr:S4 domain-containing protein [Saprospiraceae bacterium]